MKPQKTNPLEMPETNEKSKTDENEKRIKSISALTAEVNRARREMEIAQDNFDCVFNPDEVDICIYELRTAQVRYCSLLNRLKKLC